MCVWIGCGVVVPGGIVFGVLHDRVVEHVLHHLHLGGAVKVDATITTITTKRRQPQKGDNNHNNHKKETTTKRRQ